MVFLLMSIREKLTAANKKILSLYSYRKEFGQILVAWKKVKIDDIWVPFISSVYYSSIWTNPKYDPKTIIINFPAINKTFNDKRK